MKSSSPRQMCQRDPSGPVSPVQAEELAGEANARLRQTYEEILPQWKILFAKEARLNRRLSIPCFLDVQSQYFAATTRVVFVGQETHGWWTEWNGCAESLTVPEITDFYRKERPELLQKYGSPYWQAIREVATRLAIPEPESSIVFTNIFPCDEDKKQARVELHDTFREWRVLPRELAILRPDYVIFFCGRTYSGNLKFFFKRPLSGELSVRTPVLSYIPAGVTWNGFVSFHPNYLRRARLWHALDHIVQLVCNDVEKRAIETRTFDT
jgi:hypothetical protein